MPWVRHYLWGREALARGPRSHTLIVKHDQSTILMIGMLCDVRKVSARAEHVLEQTYLFRLRNELLRNKLEAILSVQQMSLVERICAALFLRD
jgi:hypothetical protein